MISISTLATAVYVLGGSAIVAILGSAASPISLENIPPAVQETVAQTAKAIIEENRETRWLMLTLAGGLLASIMAVFHKRRDSKGRPVEPERWQVITRILGALIGSTALPRVLMFIYPSLKEHALDSYLLLLAGVLCGLFGFATAPRLIDKIFSKGNDFIDERFDKLRDKEKERRRRARGDTDSVPRYGTDTTILKEDKEDK
jgi:H+/Cl- antiporter ClcA